MENVVGVRFQEAGKIYYFEAGGFENDLVVGGYAVVETSRGVELGRVVIAPGQVLSAELTEPLKSIIRPATADDIDRADDLKEKARGATEIARQRARALDLPMKIVSSQYTLDGSRLTVFFTAEGRVDFRELVRDLGHHVRAQVQLRQVGPRDQAKLIGGYGRCGRRLCCTSWLTAFPSISIKMAKEQSLPLNPSKISGQCGRLLCCLSYENDIYKRLKAELPKPDSWLSTPSGNARVLAVNAIKQVVTLQLENMQVHEFTVAQLGLEVGVVRALAPEGGVVPPGEMHVDPSAIEEPAADVGLYPESTLPGQPLGPDQRFQPDRGAALAGGSVDRFRGGPGDRRNQGENRNGLTPAQGGQGGRNRGQPRPQPAAAAAPRAESAKPVNDAPESPLQTGAAAADDGAARRRRRRRHRGKKAE
jgi:cell fate regulator YaaT (PSP1 superfamily)